jgi:hypothetical protein
VERVAEGTHKHRQSTAMRLPELCAQHAARVEPALLLPACGCRPMLLLADVSSAQPALSAAPTCLMSSRSLATSFSSWFSPG